MLGVAVTVRRLAAGTPPSRDRSIDLMRALAIGLVVLGHWFVIAVTYRDGELSGDNALHVLNWLHPFTWLFQVMPIFFLVGGYVSSASFASHRASGGDSVGWVLRRADRLLRPTTALLVVLPLATVVAVALGADKELLGTAAWLASVPLWFLLAYLAMVVLTPALMSLHRRAGLAAPIAMVVLVGVADLFRLVLGVPYVGEQLPVRLAGGLPTRVLFLWHMTAAAIAAAVLFPTGAMAQPPLEDRSWLLWRVPWLVSCSVVLAVLVAVFARIELRRPQIHAGERSGWRDGATVLGMAAVLAGLLGVALSGSDYHGVTGLPWGAVLSYLSGAAVLRLARAQLRPTSHTAVPSDAYISSTRSP